mmetsp:Transcript_2261/g.5288  ORF Transcript_2261/g.5288 Transcript_2261/m.5288 type:complete len:351 (-) Transcript_2261:92-1144(-)|eukprot:CAMPEP_0114545946 /NCGR_PEP_ID=MMETSP0114-20121206/3679_1 /TAXON_ID=31324 /ORGANISM="Goniomonas sp, Strain m" /LENGTH=350 /DNA_ID=CAMNT_0001730423 /DNA_START=55 /DNA_END=1107 /DNA_ORIENTATION=+
MDPGSPSARSPHTPPKKKLCATCEKPTQNRCARCQAVNYCNAACQRQAWKEHKKECVPWRPQAAKAFLPSALEIDPNDLLDCFRVQMPAWEEVVGLCPGCGTVLVDGEMITVVDTFLRPPTDPTPQQSYFLCPRAPPSIEQEDAFQEFIGQLFKDAGERYPVRFLGQFDDKIHPREGDSPETVSIFHSPVCPSEGADPVWGVGMCIMCASRSQNGLSFEPLEKLLSVGLVPPDVPEPTVAEQRSLSLVTLLPKPDFRLGRYTVAGSIKSVQKEVGEKVMFDYPKLEILAFPALFPSGTGGWDPKCGVVFKHYAKLRLYSCLGRFRNNTDYVRFLRNWGQFLGEEFETLFF